MPTSLEELLKPRNYMPNFLKIRTKEATLVPFILKRPQEKLLTKIEEMQGLHKPIRIIILKARQMGFSTFVEGYVFNDETTHSLKNALIIAHEDSASQNLYTMYRTYYENLPEELTPMQKTANAREMLFENPTTDIIEKRRNPGLQSRVKVATAGNVDVARSNVFHNLHCSEVAFWRDAKTLMTGMLQCVPRVPNSSIFIESTANGVGGWFYDFWKAAERGENEYVPMFFAWFEEPEYTIPFDGLEERVQFIEEINYEYKDKDGNVIHTEEWELMNEHPEITFEQMKWRKWCIRNNCHGDLEKFHQEYPANPDEAFIASGRPRFTIGVLKKYRKMCTSGKRGYLQWISKNPDSFAVQFIEDEKGYLEVFKEPEQDRFYCIGADVAEGLIDGDYSVGVCGSDEFNIDCIWYGHIDPDLFGEELVKLAIYYNQAYLGIENNNHGLTTIKAVQRLEYWNLFFTKTYDKISDTVTQKVGWSTTTRTKPMMIDKLAEFVREKWIGTKWITFINECLTYIIEDNGSTNAQEGCFLPGTKVMTNHSNCDIIDSIKEDNFVLSHKGVYRKVMKKFERNYNGIVYELKISGIPETLKLTEEHPVYVYEKEQFVWKEAKNLKKDDKILIPKRNDLPKNEFSDDLLYVMGLWLAEGSTKNDNALNFSFGITEQCLADKTKKVIDSLELDETIKTKEYINNKGTIVKSYLYKNRHNGKTRIIKRENKNIIEVIKTNKGLHDLFVCKLGKHCNLKKLSNDLFNTSNLLPLVAGLIDGDGHFRKNEPYDLTLSLTSKILIEQVRQILLDNNIYCTYQIMKRDIKKNVYTLNIKYKYAKKLFGLCKKVKLVNKTFRNCNHVIELENYFAVPIRQINNFKYNGIVYNMEVDKDNTYIANGIVVHNCHDDTVMAVGIWLQLLLEGKGENYRPENTDNGGKPKTIKRAGFTLRADEDDEDEEDRPEIAE